MEKKNNGIICLLLVIILVLIGFIVYSSITSNKETKKENNATETINEDSKISSNENTKLGYSDIAKVYLEKEKYYENIDGTNLSDGLQLGINSLVIDKSNKLIIDTYTDTTKGNSLSNKYGKDYVLSESVLKATSLYYGNAGSKAIFTIKKDGTISILKADSISSDEIKWNNNVGDLKNIVDIYEKPNYIETPDGKSIVGSKITAVDINGKEYELDNYLS